jgi:polyphenol oxidase
MKGAARPLDFDATMTDEIVLTKTEPSQGLVPVRSAMLSQLSGIAHGFYGRTGGVSSGIYESLNAGPGSGDDSGNVAENRSRIAADMGVTPDRLMSAYQIHSAQALMVDKPFTKERPQVDALVTRCPSLATTILTADCAPVLFADPSARIVAAAHAGWKGAIGGILEATLDKMCKLGAAKSRIVVAIGPCIGQASYEVGPEFLATFIEVDPMYERFFVPGNGDRLQFDLKRFCAARLRHAGVGAIDVLPHDTCALEDDFFSNRRRNLAGEPDYGRNLSAIRVAR